MNDLETLLRNLAFHANGTEAAAEIEQIRQQVAELRAERDEARREVCNMNESGLRMNDSDKQREAERRGWDCFAGNTSEHM